MPKDPIFTNAIEMMEQFQSLLSQEAFQELSHSFYKHMGKFSKKNPGALGIFDPDVLEKTWSKAQTSFQHAFEKDPKKFEMIGQHYIETLTELWGQTLSRLQGREPYHPLFSAFNDKRFKSQAWQENPIFDYFRKNYLINAQLLSKTLESLEDIDPQTKRKLSFYTRQIIDFFSPANFPMTNPDVIQETLNTQGENIYKGFQNYIDDIKTGEWRTKAAKEGTFEVGKNLACTPGHVIFENALFQLIHYTPTQSMTHEIPLLILPPWINKFYILDLQEHNSYVKWCLDQGLQVFLVSWVNPTQEQKDETLTSYVYNGVLKALEIVLEKTQSKTANVVGYCTGGILATLAELSLKHQRKNIIESLTLLAAPFDFSKAEELLTYVCEEQLRKLDDYLEENGILEGQAMVQAFSLLRSNDLIWSYYINSYLMGKDPVPFDMLYWNSDPLRLPGKLHRVYLREIVYKNILLSAKGFSLEGHTYDLSKLNKPIYLMAAKDDHIAPWKSVVALKTFLKGKKVRFCLSSSGHVAGVVNHPSKNKYQYWIQEEGKKSNDDSFADEKSANPGSWWNDWRVWIVAHSSSLKVPYKPTKKECLQAAPGSYVKVKE